MKIKKLAYIVVLVIILSLTVSFSGCKNKDDKENNKNDGSNITISLEINTTMEDDATIAPYTEDNYSYKINLGLTKTINVTAKFTNFDSAATFSTKDTGKIELGGSGNTIRLKGKKIGAATMTVKAGNKTINCLVNVVNVNDVKFIGLTNGRITIEDSNLSQLSTTLTVKYTKSYDTDNLVFESKDKNIVEIGAVNDNVVNIIGKKVGITTITATIGKATATCIVEVSNYGLIYQHTPYQVRGTNVWLDGLRVTGIKEGVTINGEVRIPEYYSYTGKTYQFDTKKTLIETGSTVIDVSMPIVLVGEDDNISTNNPFQNIKTITSAYISKNVMCIGAYCFENSGITKITFNIDCVASTIGKYAFANTAITEFIMPNKVNGYYLGEYVLSNCPNLTTVQLAEKLTIIKEGTFYNSAKLKNIFIGSSITEIQQNVFALTEGSISLDNLYYAGSPALFTNLIASNITNSVGNSALIKIDKSKIYYNATALNTGVKN